MKIHPTPVPPGLSAQVFPAEDLWVVSGANHGDGVEDPALCLPGDIYQLDREARAQRILLATGAAGPAGATGHAAGAVTGAGSGAATGAATGAAASQTVTAGSDVGQPGDAVAPVALMTLMAPDGETVEILVIRLSPATPVAAERHFVLPLSPIGPRIDYTLLAVGPPPPHVRLSDIVFLSFGRGTMISLAGGRQCPIEQLQVGDRVLTRDSGPQPIRWIGHASMRALGSFAPVVIGAGLLGNAAELVVSQHHRIFLYQRGERRLGNQAELLVQAKHLVDGEEIWLREGGTVEYYSLLFDRHEIIYAEGTPCESLLVSEATLGILPSQFSDELRRRFPGLSQRQHIGAEASASALAAGDIAGLLRRRREE